MSTPGREPYGFRYASSLNEKGPDAAREYLLAQRQQLADQVEKLLDQVDERIDG